MRAPSFLTKIFSLALGFARSFATGYVYEAQHLYNERLKQHIILLSDYHEDASISTAQRLAILKDAKKHYAYLLVEDQALLYQYLSSKKIIAYQPCLQSLIDDLISDPVNFNANKCFEQNFSILDPSTEGDGTPLFLLIHMARNMGIRASTVECRQAEVISGHGGPISAADVCLFYDKAVQQIEQYDDDDIYNTYYKNKVTDYRTQYSKAHRFFEYLRSYSGNLKQAYANRTFESDVMKATTNVVFAENDDVYEKMKQSLFVRD